MRKQEPQKSFLKICSKYVMSKHLKKHVKIFFPNVVLES